AVARARRVRRGAGRAFHGDRARERAPGDERGRGARGEGGLVIARRTFLALPLAACADALRAGDEYGAVIPDRPLVFPRDYGSHPAYRTEWWYVTGRVNDAAGNAYGVQVTFFRNRPGVAETN